MSGEKVLLKNIEDYCQDNGLILTAMRKRVLQQVMKKEPVKAYDILDSLSTKNEILKPPTIYRALDFLLKAGIIHRLELLDAYILCRHHTKDQSKHQCAFFLCGKCNNVMEVCGVPLKSWIEEVEKKKGLTIERQIVELYGCCDKCR